jgi:Ca-activated chloride channel family protein
MSAGFRRRLRATLVGTLLICLSTANAVLAQSGRNQEKKTSSSQGTSNKPKTRPRSIADPTPSPSPTARAQTPATNAAPERSTDEIDEADTVRVSSNLVPIPASVVDAKGVAITGLQLEDFELRVDGQERAISDLTRTETSVRMVMLFDNSGSLDMAREFEKRAAMHFFRMVMRPADEAAIYSIETESYLAQPLTKNVSLLQQTIANFGKPEGATSLFDAIIHASRYLRPYTGRRVLVIVSDGIETMRDNDFELTMQEAVANDCQIFVVQTGLHDGANLRALTAERRMEQFASQTGGAVYIPKTHYDVDSAFQQIAADLSQQYVLSYYPLADRRDGRFHLIDLRVRARKDVRVRARKGYYSPKGASAAHSMQ